jgi:hypothetical protein
MLPPNEAMTGSYERYLATWVLRGALVATPLRISMAQGKFGPP